MGYNHGMGDRVEEEFPIEGNLMTGTATHHQSNLVPLFFLFILLVVPAAAAQGAQDQENRGADLYRAFFDALEEMETFSFESRYLWKTEHGVIGDCTLRYFLEKPDRYRVEVIDAQGELAGLLVCDGSFCWKTWPQGTTLFTQYEGASRKETEIYMKERAFRGKSISHQLSLLPQVCMPVFNANVFFGGSESVMEYLDDVTCHGEEDVDGEPCHVLKVSMMEGQRLRTLWLSKKDNLPRRWLGELVLASPQSTTEVWSGLKVDPDIDETLFSWTPPAGYAERRLPTVEEMILQVGEKAADFELTDDKGKPISLAEYNDKIIWLMFWRIG